jgi:para-nitrobenzyl esterase
VAGRAADVPLIIGANSNEASVMFALGAHPDLTRFAGPQLDTMHAAYGHVDDQELTRQAMGDVAFVAPARFIALTEAGGAPAFLYHFAYVPPVRRGSTPGAGHGSEVPFVFNSWDAFPMAARFMQPADHQMERTLISCWTSFARMGRPLCEGAPAWPAYTLGGDQTMVFGAPTTVQTGFRKPQLDFIMSRITAAGAQARAPAP